MMRKYGTAAVVLLAAISALPIACAPAAEQSPGNVVPADVDGDANAVDALALANGISERALDLADTHDRHRVSAISSRSFSHSELWTPLGATIEGSPVLSREEIGRSAEGRPLYLVRYGTGPTVVLLWSQMHGDESTATMALLDIFNFLAEEPDHPIARTLSDELTIAAIPMLNPDGAARFQRRSAHGIDINRDARELATPEAQALRAQQERFRPDFGFNLHDQNVRTPVGDSDRIAAISLLAPAYDESRSYNEVRERARQVAAVLRSAVEPLVGDHVARYGDAFNPRAFGDLVQSWGTSTVLVESGGWRDDPEKQHLRKTNFVGLLLALESIATGDYAQADHALYEDLEFNGSSVNDVLLMGGAIVVPGIAPYRADVAINFEDPHHREGGRVADIGDLREYAARDTVDVSGLFLHPGPDVLSEGSRGGVLLTGAAADFIIRRGRGEESDVVWVAKGGVLSEPQQ